MSDADMNVPQILRIHRLVDRWLPPHSQQCPCGAPMPVSFYSPYYGNSRFGSWLIAHWIREHDEAFLQQREVEADCQHMGGD